MKQILVAVLLVFAFDIAAAQENRSASELCDRVERLSAQTRSRIKELSDERDEAQRKVESLRVELDTDASFIVFLDATVEPIEYPSLKNVYRRYTRLKNAQSARDDLAKKISLRFTVLNVLWKGQLLLCPEDDAADASTPSAGTSERLTCDWARSRASPILGPYLGRSSVQSIEDCKSECEKRLPECLAIVFQSGKCLFSDRLPRTSERGRWDELPENSEVWYCLPWSVRSAGENS